MTVNIVTDMVVALYVKNQPANIAVKKAERPFFLER